MYSIKYWLRDGPNNLKMSELAQTQKYSHLSYLSWIWKAPGASYGPLSASFLNTRVGHVWRFVIDFGGYRLFSSFKACLIQWCSWKLILMLLMGRENCWKWHFCDFWPQMGHNCPKHINFWKEASDNEWNEQNWYSAYIWYHFYTCFTYGEKGNPIFTTKIFLHWPTGAWVRILPSSEF